MPRPYKASNRRLIHRLADGRFRESALSDIGMACCEQCGVIYKPDVEALRDGPFIDPKKFRLVNRLCPDCLEQDA